MAATIPTTHTIVHELFRERQFAVGAELCKLSLRDGCGSTSLRLMLARALLAMGCHERANRYLCQCIEFEPRCADAYRILAKIAVCRGDFYAAEVFLRDALEIDGDDDEPTVEQYSATGPDAPTRELRRRR